MSETEKDLEQKRAYLRGLYPGSSFWDKKVNKMSEAQVTAIYLRHINQAKDKEQR